MHEHPCRGGKEVGEAIKYWSHYERYSHKCPHKVSLVDLLRMSEVLNNVRSSRMFMKREDSLRSGDAHPLR
ncbi:hypothetical protein Y032_0355g3341 [Ancylostoma ceylanicum]|uniref:Uncharacterized protein n=1 Tax=Ancylostoma ceylanicum TaxID=53326 RepID=A0A016RXE1_9BILA|nr:hypothetical protein Y032_0355g3341 [Ancylostoma ceylanicum]